ncbi:DUF1501 domain-containing protein [Lignipirellula cremea]|uniref:DUF1501 domain-containing protein n=1 Tax=Lignipirellula cremea TaxID=2528010 RepID=A0A518DSK9_9BACT|nr:DUF1501 domain-containing protein [Lignipirellula cremea]QDU94831.1 hypothetical protein Pla8534_26390 [Lignipirellula cremea]
MLRIFDDNRRFNRRAMLQIGGLGLSGMSLANLLAARSLASGTGKPITTGKSVIFLLQHGGPTQFETFDPKPDAPDSIRTVGGVTSTASPGMQFGASMSQLAKLADKLAVVRSYATNSSAHSIRPIVSEASRQANIGAIYSRLAGANHPTSGMPRNVTLFPKAVLADGQGPETRFGDFNSTGNLGRGAEPFSPGGGSNLQKDMQLSIPSGRLDDRRNLLASLDQLRAEADRTGGMEGVDKFREQAYDMVFKGVADAFDLSKEDPRTIARYDTAAHLHERSYYAGKTNGNDQRNWYQENARSLGKLLLLARRLCEAGCGFVTVTTRFVWDMHADANNLGVDRGMEAVGLPYDHAVAAFIQDCEERGLGNDILLVSTGEMGRTPKINARGGRDHWGGLTPMLLYGGGLTHGQTIGQSTRDGGQPAVDACNTDNLIATIMHTLFDVGELRIRQGLPVDLVRMVGSGEPIPGLF